QKFIWWLTDKASPLSDKKHLTLYASHKYPNNVTLAKNVLAFDDGELVNYNYWNHHFSIEDLEKEVNAAGFTLENVYADVNGGDYKNNSEFFAVILKKDRKSTRLNSSHVSISYAVFCLKKKKMNAMRNRNRERSRKY